MWTAMTEFLLETHRYWWGLHILGVVFGVAIGGSQFHEHHFEEKARDEPGEKPLSKEETPAQLELPRLSQ